MSLCDTIAEGLDPPLGRKCPKSNLYVLTANELFRLTLQLGYYHLYSPYVLHLIQIVKALYNSLYLPYITLMTFQKLSCTNPQATKPFSDIGYQGQGRPVRACMNASCINASWSN